ncbi:TolC family protein [Siphonobacter aquaeclarae]|jgi:multidrug efflux system outer membrane protein|uniref:Efflux transporter, outer membrane factor (OMF) lipoprotein, NodT family n=1 Tax=Siphonobacter aquaeclarae TaxID=563176 RepID=A0A1G9I2D5_9BACT|nr:TolC family protein [Siphonobacter aquaeclarae]MBO9638656.1 TolC family protein [Siphonobacter aquaeclarae]SDL19225.1 efflux transporter, outer membrane factor (OMF) lipoprotein, NodT family [Siphonobacter aquaeclarae]
MYKRIARIGLGVAFLSIAITGCKTPVLVTRTENRNVPGSFDSSQDSTNTARMKWREFFTDPNLVSLIDTALHNNQELNITLQEIEISRNEIQARKGEYLPFVGLRGSMGVDKVGRYTVQGATEATTEIKPGKEMPDPVPNFLAGAFATWEIDIWNKLHNAKKAAVNRYLGSIEGRNFLVTNLISEIANSYYELLALDTQLDILNRNIEIQTNALKIVRLQKEATKVTELAVRRFEAQVLNTQSMQYTIRQRIIETENRINFLVGRYPQPVTRTVGGFENMLPAAVKAGLPSQLLANRPDIRQAEQELAATKLDVQVAKARFYPSLGISAGFGYNAFNPAYIIRTPQSLLFSLAGDLTAPLVNKNAIKAAYFNANAKQIQAVFNYERTILNAYIEVANQLSNITNLEKSYDLKSREVQALTQSVTISNTLFMSARADYMEVLLTQRDALESRFDLVETKMKQMNAMVNIYRALGGGWN